MKVYITKYVLSSGILEKEAHDTHDPNMIRCGDGKTLATQFFHKGEWHLTRKEAVSKALDIIAGKRFSIAKQLGKLHQLEIKLKTERAG